jgi:hypothetical protein
VYFGDSHYSLIHSYHFYFAILHCICTWEDLKLLVTSNLRPFELKKWVVRPVSILSSERTAENCLSVQWEIATGL